MANESENVEIGYSSADIAPNSGEGQAVCYCGGVLSSGMLKCLICGVYFHMSCLRNGRPSSLEGDVYFDFTCAKCSDSGAEECIRRPMNWLQVIYIALYNLSCNGSGRKGYFRWKDDICRLIDSNWNTFHGDRKRTSSWHSTVAGILSTNCPKYFKNGQKEFREGGWWTLTELLPPFEKIEVNATGMRRRKKSSQESVTKTRTSERKRKLDEQVDREKTEEKVSRLNVDQEKAGEKVKVKKTGERVENVDEGKMEEKGKKVDGMLDVAESMVEVDDMLEGFLGTNVELLDLDIGDVDPMENIFDDDFENVSLSLNFPEEHIISGNCEEKSDQKSETNIIEDKTVSEETQGVILLDPEAMPSVPSLPNPPTEPPKRGRQTTEPTEVQAQGLRAMHPHEELEFLEKLNRLDSQNPVARRLRRKLQLRQRKRQFGLPVLDLDGFVRRTLAKVSHYVVKGNDVIPVMTDSSEAGLEKPKSFKRHTPSTSDRILDRFMALAQAVSSKRHNNVSFLTRLIGSHVTQPVTSRTITSPYTSRVLKPYIRQDCETRPPKLKILREICSRYEARGADPEWIPPIFGPIDYCYVQPHHISSVNALCREFFWPGIDLSECLQYPDFSCVVLYRRMVIGCAFMVPDVRCNEAYISFIVVHPDWRRAGIGSFMIYHLIQTCLGKDVTLHVSANNPSMLLYQKFGFKPERFVVNFYERYLDCEKPEHKHAFFMRLRR